MTLLSVHDGQMLVAELLRTSKLGDVKQLVRFRKRNRVWEYTIIPQRGRPNGIRRAALFGELMRKIDADNLVLDTETRRQLEQMDKKGGV